MNRPALLLIATLVVAAPLAAADGVIPPQLTAPDSVRTLFRDEWRVPALRVSEDDRRPPVKVDLLSEMKTLARLEFPFQEGERRLKWTHAFGDLVRGLREAKDDPARRQRMLKILREGRPSVWERVGDYLPALVNDDRVYTDDWDTEENEWDDGLLLVEPFDRSASGDPYWSALDGTNDMYQAATLIYADLEAIKAAENDFAAYPDNVNADYEFIHGVRGGYLRTRCAAGRDCTVVRMTFQTDLPFPYGVFDADVRIRTTVDDDGHVVTDLHSPSSDVYWLGGQDVCIPVFASDGEWVAMLHVRVYGFDLRGVPDGDGTRQEVILSSLGNLKRRAETRYAAYGGPPRTVKGAIPEFLVRGVGPAPEERGDDD
jgi:hypothetical protein